MMEYIIFVLFFLSSSVLSSALPTKEVAVNATVNYRLPKTIIPITYSLELFLTSLDEKTNSFSGVSEIAIQIIETTREIKLHAKELSISMTLLFDKTNQPLGLTNGGIDTVTDILTITTNEDLKKGETYRLEITFTGKLNQNEMDGFYKSSYTELNGTDTVTKYLATTQFESTSARRAFPCFDEPGFKANFTLTITIPKGLVVQSNTPLESSIISGQNIKNTFKQTPTMSTYLVAFTISEFTSDESKIGTVPFKVWSRKEESSKRKLALENGPSLIAELEKTFNIKYESTNIGKMDIYAIPDFSAGAMENWGHVTFRETAVLYDDTEAPYSSQQYVLRVIAHEFTHMWFGDLVTLDWWSDAFLNEGFATYFEYFATHNVKPEFDLEKQFVAYEMNAALKADSNENSKALSFDVSTPDEISERFDTIAYEKAGSVIRMVVNLMGKSNFVEGIRNYLNNFKYQNVKPEDLWSTLGKEYTLASDLTLSTVMTNWTIKPGYPYLRVTSSGNNVKIEQKRFVFSGTFDTEWYVPISYRSSSKADFSITTPTDWLKPGQSLVLTDVLKNENWIIFNNQQTGFYRVLYDNNLLSKIEGVLNDDPQKIHVLNRAGLIDDLENFARANLTRYSQYFDTIEYLKKETEVYPWNAAFNGISNVLDSLSAGNLKNQIKEHVAGLLGNVYKSVPVGTLKPNDHIYTMKQVLIQNWACKLNNQDCNDNAKKLFQNYKDKGEKPDKNLRSVVFCSVLRTSLNIDDFNFLWNKFNATNDATEKVTILKSLGCPEQPIILKVYLNLIFDPKSEIRLQDVSTAVSSIYAGNNEVGLNVVLEYLVTNYKTVYNRWSEARRIKALIEALAERFTSQKQYDQLKDLLDQDEVGADIKTVVETAINKSKSRLQIVSNVQAQLAEYFDNKGGFGNTISPNLGLLLSIIVTFIVLI